MKRYTVTNRECLISGEPTIIRGLIEDIKGPLCKYEDVKKLENRMDNLIFRLEQVVKELIEYPKHIPVNRKSVMAGIVGGIQHTLKNNEKEK